jgi:hypothetical protein
MGAAYGVAVGGDTILMRGGTYPTQTIPNRSLGTTNVLFQSAPNETVIVDGSMAINTGNITIHGGDTLGVDEEENRFVMNGDGGTGMDHLGGDDIQDEDIHVRSWYVAGATNTRVRFSEIGPSNMDGGDFCGDLVLAGGTNTIVEYNLVHDNLMGGCGGAHIDAFDVDGGGGITIRGNRIWWCGTQCIFSGDPGDYLVEHNMVEETNGCGDCAGPSEFGLMGDIIFRYNTIEMGGGGFGCEPEQCNGGRAAQADANHNVGLGGPVCATDSSGIAQTVCDSNLSTSGSGGTNAVTCAVTFANAPTSWTNVDRQADYFFAADPGCTNGTYGASDPLIPTWDGTPP